ncbi:Vegetative incompatibility protein HET-E-1 [Trametes pubescens]|uniref:Vegetative incompatibility protein HET-E-1 n=1 Tax=Trametes pubescens TaxID=154538 RepID=A0A1M2W552_TRAPU|nr:Vegetative incompatibility protein HET-E-1 [Trametes pubescens]
MSSPNSNLPILRHTAPTPPSSPVPPFSRRNDCESRSSAASGLLAPSPRDARTIGHKGSVVALAYSHNSKLLATGACDAAIILWDASNKTILHKLEAHVYEVCALAFSPDDQRLASACPGGKVIVWSVQTGERLGTMDQHEPSLLKNHAIKLLLAWSADGRWIASGAFIIQNTVHLWDADTFEKKRIFEHDGVFFVGFSHDSLWLVSCGMDNCARIWDVAQGAPYAVLRGPEDIIAPNSEHVMHHADFDADDRRLVTCSSDHSVLVWNIEGGENDKSVDRAECVEEGKSVEAGNIVKSGKILVRFPEEPRNSALYVAFSNDGTRVLTVLYPDGMMRLHDSLTGQCQVTFEGHKKPIHSICFSPDQEYIASGSSDNTVRLWRVSDGALLRMFTDHQCEVNVVMFSPDGSTLTSGGSDDTVRIRLAHEWLPGPAVAPVEED